MLSTMFLFALLFLVLCLFNEEYTGIVVAENFLANTEDNEDSSNYYIVYDDEEKDVYNKNDIMLDDTDFHTFIAGRNQVLMKTWHFTFLQGTANSNVVSVAGPWNIRIALDWQFIRSGNSYFIRNVMFNKNIQCLHGKNTALHSNRGGWELWTPERSPHRAGGYCFKNLRWGTYLTAMSGPFGFTTLCETKVCNSWETFQIWTPNPPTLRPTTAKPTLRPITASPTQRPITAAPTLKPTTSQPTIRPTKAPSGTQDCDKEYWLYQDLAHLHPKQSTFGNYFESAEKCFAKCAEYNYRYCQYNYGHHNRACGGDNHEYNIGSSGGVQSAVYIHRAASCLPSQCRLIADGTALVEGSNKVHLGLGMTCQACFHECRARGFKYCQYNYCHPNKACGGSNSDQFVVVNHGAAVYDCSWYTHS